MARARFRIKDLCGGDLKAAQRFFAGDWDLLELCVEAQLYRREAQVLIWWAKELSLTEISEVTGVALPHVRPTWKRAVHRIAEYLQAKDDEEAQGRRPAKRGGWSVARAASILWTFRNRNFGKDHGPQISGTRLGNFREVWAPQLVSADDLAEREPAADSSNFDHPGLDVIFRRLRLD